MKTFSEKVLSVVMAIPRGSTLSYGEVASRAGSPLASRAVGSILRKNYREDVPCHRVICSNGDIGEYNRGIENKRKILIEEGCIIKKRE